MVSSLLRVRVSLSGRGRDYQFNDLVRCIFLEISGESSCAWC